MLTEALKELILTHGLRPRVRTKMLTEALKELILTHGLRPVIEATSEACLLIAKDIAKENEKTATEWFLASQRVKLAED